MSGDNFHFDITGAPLNKSLEIALIGAPGGKAVGFSTPDNGALLLHWTDSLSTTISKFPSPLSLDGLVPLVRGWLEEQNYGGQPDHDGDNERGWRVYNESWGRVGNDWSAFAAIKPAWIMYGK